jgi:hypothetical protein
MGQFEAEKVPLPFGDLTAQKLHLQPTGFPGS